MARVSDDYDWNEFINIRLKKIHIVKLIGLVEADRKHEHALKERADKSQMIGTEHASFVNERQKEVALDNEILEILEDRDN